jgi:hypothetical protein
MKIKDGGGPLFFFRFLKGLNILAFMKSPFALASLVAVLFGTLQGHAQSFNFDFSDNTPDGWSNSGFGSTPPATVSTIGGNNYIFIPLGGFQVANVGHGADGSDFYNTMQAVAANPNGYNLSYNWRVDTSTFGANSGTFLQIGSFVNTGSSYYAQDGTEVQLDGTQVASGQVFTGTVTVNMGAVGFAMPADTFYRLGLIENGNGTAPPVGVYFTDISIAPVPEPSLLSLFGLALPALWMVRRRRSNQR